MQGLIFLSAIMHLYSVHCFYAILLFSYIPMYAFTSHYLMYFNKICELKNKKPKPTFAHAKSYLFKIEG